MITFGLTGWLFQNRPYSKTALLLLRSVGQYIGRGKGRCHFIVSQYIAQGNRMRGRGNIRGIHLLQYLEVLQYIGKLDAELLQVILVDTQSSKKSDMLYFLSA
jgi:hypothetical protein